jgi:hypothetical protein
MWDLNVSQPFGAFYRESVKFCCILPSSDQDKLGTTLKDVVFWEMETQFVPHRKQVTSSLQSPAGYCYVRLVVSTAVTMKNAVFWDIKTQFLRHRLHSKSPLQSPAG